MHALIGHRPGAGDGELVPQVAGRPGLGRLPWPDGVAEGLGHGPWRTAGVFATHAAARVFVEDRAGYDLALTCVAFVAQLATAMLLLVLLFGERGVRSRSKPRAVLLTIPSAVRIL